MKLIHEGDPDKLAYGWWCSQRGIVKLPRTLGAKNNFVLTHEELCHYDMLLREMKQKIDREYDRVSDTLRVLRKGDNKYIPGYRMEPTCFTFAHVMQLMVTIAKSKLATLNLLNAVLEQRKNERSPGNPDESPSSPAA